MKKLVLHIMTGISSIWLIDLLLSGFVFKNKPLTVLWVALCIVIGIFFVDLILEKVSIRSSILIFLISVLLNFFVLYIASLIIPEFKVNPGSFNWLDVKLIKSMDQILTLLLGATITTSFVYLTKWASSPSY